MNYQETETTKEPTAAVRWFEGILNDNTVNLYASLASSMMLAHNEPRNAVH